MTYSHNLGTTRTLNGFGQRVNVTETSSRAGAPPDDDDGRKVNCCSSCAVKRKTSALASVLPRHSLFPKPYGTRAGCGRYFSPEGSRNLETYFF